MDRRVAPFPVIGPLGTRAYLVVSAREAWPPTYMVGMDAPQAPGYKGPFVSSVTSLSRNVYGVTQEFPDRAADRPDPKAPGFAGFSAALTRFLRR